MKKALKKPPPSSARKKAPSTAHLDELSELIASITDKRAAARDLSEEVKELQARALDIMDKHGMEGHTVTLPSGKKAKATRVQASSDVLDQEKLKKKIGSKMWDRITTRVLDKKKFDAHIASKEIPLTVVAECSTTKTNAPFIKVT